MNKLTVPTREDAEPLRAEITRLNKVVQALMNRAERGIGVQGSEFSLFQTAVMLEDQVRSRTRELQTAAQDNARVNQDLHAIQERMAREIHERRAIQAALEREKEEQQQLILKLEEAHSQLLQSEKLASIGQLAAGVAHEINNPIGFVNSNLRSLRSYIADLMQLLDAYEASESLLPDETAAGIRALKERIDLVFLREDIGSLIEESTEGATRVRRIVQDLRDFSRVGDTEWQEADLHEGLETTLNVAANELKYRAKVTRNYGELPLVECVPAQLNQVFLNLLVNAAQALPRRGGIHIKTWHQDGQVRIAVADDGAGIPEEILGKIFDPFFTTKPVGTGTGLGLSVSYGIVQRHGGRIEVQSEPGSGTTFTVVLPVRRDTEEADSP